MLIASLGTAASAQAQTTIADWTFETSQPATAGPFSPEVGSGSAVGLHASGTVVYSTPAGNGSSHSFSSTMWAVGDYYQYQVNTTGLDNIKLMFDQVSSNTGPKDFLLEYSTDGTSFTTFTPYSVLWNNTPNPLWNATTSSSIYSFTEDLSSISAIDNAPTVYFRVAMADTVAANSGSPVATAGTDRMDNVVVTGMLTPEPSGIVLALVGLAGLGLAAARRRRK